MNEKKFFELALEKGMSAAELSINKNTNTNCTVFREAIENFSISSSTSIRARGIINEKFGSSSTNKDTSDTPLELVNNIIDTSKLIEKEEKAIIFKGSKKYKKRKKVISDLDTISMEEKINILFALEKRLKESPEIIECEISYEESSNVSKLTNSYGLKLQDKMSYYVIVAQVVGKINEEVQSDYKVFIGTSISEFDIEKYSTKLIKSLLAKFGGTQCASKNYKTLLAPEVISSLLSAFVSSTSAESVQKGTSLLADKLHTLVASSKVTIIEDQTANNIFFQGYDDEGVATYKKDIVKKGVLETFLYNLETADKDGVESTGNGFRLGSKIGISTQNLILKSGKKSFEELCLKIKNGVYITSITGLHAGLNPSSGNFSLQSSGFMIRDGKVAEPLSLITLSGNLFQLFKDIKEVGSDSELLSSAITCPSVYVKSLVVSGK